MSLDTEDYAWLAKDAYQNRPEYVGNNKRSIALNGHQYRIIDYASTPTGFHATAYQQVDAPHAIVIAYRGTDPDFKQHPLTTLQDVSVDAIMVTDTFNAQEASARAFTGRVLDYAKRHDIATDHVTVTGHSLGGTLAEIEAWRYGLHGQTFNAFGATDLSYGMPAGGDQVINNMLAGDVVSAGRHFGQARIFATPADIGSLQNAGYLEGHHGTLDALRAMRLSDHGLDNFAPDAGEGASVLTADNEALAHAYATPIARYRQDVQAARGALHTASTIPLTPLWQAARMAEATEAVTSLGQSALNDAQRLEHMLTGKLRQGAHALETTAQHAEHDLTQEAARVSNILRHGSTAIEQDWQHRKDWTKGKSHPTLSLASPAHPDHALYEQALAGVRVLDAAHQRETDASSVNLAAALTAAAKREGLSRIDQVALSDDSSRAFAVQNASSLLDLNRFAHVETMTAVQTPLAQSSLLAASIPPPAPAIVQEPVQAQTQARGHGPVM